MYFRDGGCGGDKHGAEGGLLPAALPLRGKGRCVGAWVTLFAPRGKGAALERSAPGFGVSWEGRGLGAVYLSGRLGGRAGDGGCAAVYCGTLYVAAMPQGGRRALPAPAQGSRPLRIPFWGTGGWVPAIPSTPPQAHAAVNARLHPIRDATTHPYPLRVWHGCVNPAPKALAAGLEDLKEHTL